MKTKEQLKQLIRNYFYTIYEKGEISSQETFMCLDNYMQLLLLNKNVDPSSVNYVIHKANMKKVDETAVAKMNYEDNIFHIYLNAINFSMQRIPKPEKTNNFTSEHISKLRKIINLFIHFGHETQHLLQYVLAPKLMEKYDDYLFDLEMKTYILDKKDNTRENRKLSRKLKNLLNQNKDVSKIELNATLRSYQNFVALLQDIIKNEQNKSFVHFINLMFEQIEHFNILDYINDKDIIKQAKLNVKDLVENHSQDPDVTFLF